MKRVIFLIFLMIILSYFFIFNLSSVRSAGADNLENIQDNLSKTGEEFSSIKVDKQIGGVAFAQIWVGYFVGIIIRYIVSFVGVVLALFIIYAGWLWMTAGGNEEQITKAKGILKNSIIALAIILGAWVITKLVINAINLSTAA